MLRNLKEGTYGSDVKSVQEALNLHPLGQRRLVPDGRFGPKTKAAVIAFQKKKHLVPDGIFGPVTMAALYPYGTYRLKLTVSAGVAAAPAPRKQKPEPALHPLHPVTTADLPGMPMQLPAPLLTSPTAQPASAQTSQIVQVKAGENISIPLKQFPTPSSPSKVSDTIAIDWIGMLYTPRHLSLGPLSGPATAGIDLGLGIPVSDGAKFTANALWAVSLAPDMFKFGRYDLLSLSAKAGVGVVGQNSNPTSYFSAGGSLALGMSYDLIPGAKGEPALLKVFLVGAFSASLDHRDSKFHLTTTLPATLGFQGNF